MKHFNILSAKLQICENLIKIRKKLYFGRKNSNKMKIRKNIILGAKIQIPSKNQEKQYFDVKIQIFVKQEKCEKCSF